MERLKKRCLAVSFSGHFLLLLALLLGPLLIPKTPILVAMPIITYIPASFLEGIIGTGGGSGGGAMSSGTSPAKKALAPKPQELVRNSTAPLLVPEKDEILRTTQPQVSPSKPLKSGKDPEIEPKAEVRTLPKSVIPDLTRAQKRKPPSKREIESETRPNHETSVEKRSKSSPKTAVQPNLKLGRSRIDETAEKAKRDQEFAEASRRAGEERGALINSVAAKIGSAVGAGLSIQGLSSIGTGIGGDGYASYGQVLIGIYQKAWMEPSEVEGNQHVVKTEVVVGKDGHVISGRIVGRCRSEAVNQSVQRALDRVRKLDPFPLGMNDLSKTFLLDFDLQSKRNAG